MVVERFLYILRLGLGLDDGSSIDFAISDSEWADLVKLAKKHAVIGTFSSGIERLPAAQMPPRNLKLSMIAHVTAIRRANAQLNQECVKVTDTLRTLGYKSCVIKGQGLADYYPEPMLRQPGDIDIWVKVTSKDDHKINAKIPMLVKKIRSLNKGLVDGVAYHHVSWCLHDGPEVEIHHRLSFFWNPIINRRLQRWSDRQWDNIYLKDGYYRLTPKFNVVFLMIHIFRHLTREGIGIRQVMDLAMVLNATDFTTIDIDEIQQTCRHLRIARFASGLMWVMKEFFKLPTHKLVFQPNEKDGMFLAKEILIAGNFGKYDTRVKRPVRKRVGGLFIPHTKHTIRFMSKYPGEAIFDIPFRLYDHIWMYVFKKRCSI